MRPESQPLDPARSDRRIRFDRNELSGAFGDLGTSLPLLVGMVVASGLDAASVLIVFGVLQVATGLVYGLPMPVQPLKAVAAIVIAERLPPGVLAGGGLAIGVVMLVLTLTGSLAWVARTVPHVVVRGLQLGLGLQLALVAIRDFIPALGGAGYALALLTGIVVTTLLGNRRVPPAPVVVVAGAVFAFLTGATEGILHGAGFALPRPGAPSWAEIGAGLLLLALPQVPLSIGNSVLATQRLASDLFPERRQIPVERIGFTYALMNVVAPLLGGVPVCHGSGGMAGHYALGGRTGGSVIIYGTLLLAAGLLLGAAAGQVVRFFPLPMLGVLLLVEAVVLVRLARDLPMRASDGLPLAVAIGIVAVTVPYGYAIGLVAGTAAWYGLRHAATFLSDS